MKERWSSRKFWSAMTWQAVNTGLLYSGALPSESYVAITYLILGGYFAANIAQRWVER